MGFSICHYVFCFEYFIIDHEQVLPLQEVIAQIFRLSGTTVLLHIDRQIGRSRLVDHTQIGRSYPDWLALKQSVEISRSQPDWSDPADMIQIVQMLVPLLLLLISVVVFLQLLEGYGQTECHAICCLQLAGDYSIGQLTGSPCHHTHLCFLVFTFFSVFQLLLLFCLIGRQFFAHHPPFHACRQAGLYKLNMVLPLILSLSRLLYRLHAVQVFIHFSSSLCVCFLFCYLCVCVYYL